MADINERKARYSVSDASKASSAVEGARTSNKSWAERRKEMRKNVLGKKGSSLSSWKRETHMLPRDEARSFAKSFLKKYPKAAYWSEVESWRVLDNDIIEFTMRRLPSAD